MRATPEWIGSSDDARVPPRVRLRIFNDHSGVCYLSGRKIMPADKWEVEHKVALCNGGEHRESNMAPALVAPHKEKTKSDLKLKSKITRIRKRHLGIKKSGRTIPGRKFNGEPIFARERQ